MEANEIKALIDNQREYFYTGSTLSLKFRIEQLKKLKFAIEKYEQDILDALKSDLGKCNFESYMCEVGLSLSEISFMLKHIKKFAKDKKVHTPLSQFSSKSYVKTCPYGNVLIMSPWNYPFLLTISPLVNAISAGNTAIIKPSAYSPATSRVVSKLIAECFEPRYVATILGGRQENSALLEQKFDFVFFTGSTNVGKVVLRNTAEHLTPAVLELGGKSPCIVDKSANIELSARRIVFGKYLNCGQTCVAPDYIWCDETVKDKLASEIIKQIKIQYGEAPFENSNYGKIINEKHFDRINNLIRKDKLIYGGASNKSTLQIEPTVLDNVTFDDAVMGEEIFGPVLPIMTYKDIGEVITKLHSLPKPLALYLFSNNKTNIKLVTEQCQYGGGCINDTIIHLATSEMPFGGVGESGMGAYHGKTGFDTFSHKKSIVHKKNWIDLNMRYSPHKSKFYKIIRFFLK